MAEAYCVKCKAKKEMVKAEEVKMKNGRPAMQGICPDCGTKLFRIMAARSRRYLYRFEIAAPRWLRACGGSFLETHD